MKKRLASRTTGIPVLLSILISIVACKEQPKPVPVVVESGKPDRPVKVVSPDGIQDVDDTTAETINSVLNQLNTMTPEEGSAADKAAAVDASRLVGEWQIQHLIHRTDGKVSQSEPLMPTRWTIGPDGTFTVNGGMSMNLRYIYTGDKLIVTGLGPKMEYTIDKLTDTTLQTTNKITAGNTHIENTTVLQKVAPSKNPQ